MRTSAESVVKIVKSLDGGVGGGQLRVCFLGGPASTSSVNMEFVGDRFDAYLLFRMLSGPLKKNRS